jgi:hypothetical protein
VIQVAFAPSFKRSNRKRVQGSTLEKRFWERLDWFVTNPFDARLRTHKLSGKLAECWAFSFVLKKQTRKRFYSTSAPMTRFIDPFPPRNVYFRSTRQYFSGTHSAKFNARA